MNKIRIFLIFILFALFASIFSLQKICLNYSEPLFLIGFRMFFAGIILFLFLIILDYKQIKIKKKNIYLFIYLAIFNIYLTNSFEILGLKNMTSAKACLIYSLSPFFTYFLAFFLLNETISLLKTFGIVIGFLGLLPMIFFKTNYELNINTFLYFSFAEIFLLLAVIFNAIGWIILKKILNNGYSFFFANSISMVLGGFLILIQSFLSGENWTPIPVINVKYFILYTSLTCLISNIICYNLFGYLLKYFSATFMTFSGLMTPLFAAFFGYIFLNEKITIHFYISMLIFLFGLIILFYEEKK